MWECDKDSEARPVPVAVQSFTGFHAGADFATADKQRDSLGGQRSGAVERASRGRRSVHLHRGGAGIGPGSSGCCDG